MISRDDTKAPDHRRRQVCVASLLAFGCPPATLALAQGAPIDPYALLSVTGIALQRPLLDCDGLRQQIASIERQQKDLAQNPTAAGAAYMSRALAQRESLKTARQKATDAIHDANVEVAISSVGLALGTVIGAFAIILEAPVAIGSLIAVEIIAAPSLFAVQVIAKRRPESLTLLAGYSVERTLLIAEIIGEKAASTAGRVAANCISGVAQFLAARSLVKALAEKEKAIDSLNDSLRSLQAIDVAYRTLGNNPTGWANALSSALAAAKVALQGFVRETERDKCQLRVIQLRRS